MECRTPEGGTIERNGSGFSFCHQSQRPIEHTDRGGRTIRVAVFRIWFTLSQIGSVVVFLLVIKRLLGE